MKLCYYPKYAKIMLNYQILLPLCIKIWLYLFCISIEHIFLKDFKGWLSWSRGKELDCRLLGRGFKPLPLSGTPVATLRLCPDNWLAQFSQTHAQRWPKRTIISFRNFQCVFSYWQNSNMSTFYKKYIHISQTEPFIMEI